MVGGRFELEEGTQARFEAGHVLVGPVRGFEVRGHVRVFGAEEVEEEEEGDGG